MLTASQQDYVEIIHRLERSVGPGGVHVADISRELGTRPPTVTRSLRRLVEMGLVVHPKRRNVTLTELGRKIAREIVHLHDDLVTFFTSILGLSHAQAEEDVSQIEHGLSRLAAQRFHEFIEYHHDLPATEQKTFEKFLEKASGRARNFRNLPRYKSPGWRT